MRKIKDRTYRIKQDLIKGFKKEFRLHDEQNLTEYVLKNAPDEDHRHNGVAKDIANKLKNSGRFIYRIENDNYVVTKNIDLPWKDRNWILFEIIRAAIIVVLTLLLNKLILQK